MRSIMIRMKMMAGLYLIMLKIEIFGTSCIMCAHALGDTSIPSRGYGRIHPRAGNDRYVLHNAAVTVTSSNECPA